jgi:hypothetical protein
MVAISFMLAAEVIAVNTYSHLLLVQVGIKLEPLYNLRIIDVSTPVISDLPVT